LRSIPVVGWLFKSKSSLKTKNELLVFLTPRIIKSENSSEKEGSL
jgi:type II secretory pathway component GspD/PulD (secretin)